jgi:hypothetical protein
VILELFYHLNAHIFIAMVLKTTTPDDVHGDFDVEHIIQNASISDKISLLSGE